MFDSQAIAQTVAFGFRIGEIGVPTRYLEGASSVNSRRGVVYGFATLWTLARFIVHRWGLMSVPQFSLPLRDVISRYHRAGLFREAR